MRIRSLANGLVIPMLLLVSLGLSVALLEFAAGFLYDRAGLANGKRIVDLYLGRTTEEPATGIASPLSFPPRIDFETSGFRTIAT